MVLEFYDKNLKYLGQVSEFESLTWVSRFQEPGEFELYTWFDTDLFPMMRTNNFIMRNDRDQVYQIKRVELSRDDQGNYIAHLTGKDVLAALKQRIIYNTITHNGDAGAFIKKIIEQNVTNADQSYRNIPIFTSLTVPTVGKTIKSQVRWDTVQEKVQELLAQFNLGIKAEKVSGGIGITVYKQKDRTIFQTANTPLAFTDYAGNLTAWSFAQDYEEYTNFAYIAGETEDVDISVSSNSTGITLNLAKTEKKRIVKTIGDRLTGLDRYELYVDARDLQSETDSGTQISEDDYAEMLIQRGYETLAEHLITYEMDAEAMPDIKYPTDYQLGDVATVDTSIVMADARISEVTEIFDSNGYSAFPTFEILALHFNLATESYVDLTDESGDYEILT